MKYVVNNTARGQNIRRKGNNCSIMIIRLRKSYIAFLTRVALERQIARLAKSPKLMSTNGVVRKSIAKSINRRKKCTKSWALVKIETRVEPVCALLIMAQITVAFSLPDILLSYLKTRTIIFAATSEKTAFHDSGVSPLLQFSCPSKWFAKCASPFATSC